MITAAQLKSLQTGDCIEYTNVNSQKTSMWEVDHPQVMINGKHHVRVSICTPNGRGSNRMSMLLDNFENWNVCQNRNVVEDSVAYVEETAAVEEPVNPVAPAAEELPLFEILSVDPMPNAVDIPVNSQIIFQFNQPVIKLAGNITLEAGEMTQVIDVQSQSVIVDGSKLVVTPPAGLANATVYNVVIDSNAFANMASTPVNILGSNMYSFTTAQ